MLEKTYKCDPDQFEPDIGRDFPKFDIFSIVTVTGP